MTQTMYAHMNKIKILKIKKKKEAAIWGQALWLTFIIPAA
jgi:hypothetical protein